MKFLFFVIFFAAPEPIDSVTLGERFIPNLWDPKRLPFYRLQPITERRLAEPPALALGDVTSSPTVTFIESIPVERRLAIITRLCDPKYRLRRQLMSVYGPYSDSTHRYYAKYLLTSLFMTARTLGKLVEYSFGSAPSALASAADFTNSHSDFTFLDSPMRIRDWYSTILLSHYHVWNVAKQSWSGHGPLPEDELVSVPVSFWKSVFLEKNRKDSLLLTGYESIEL